jgi:hypothetical protein
LPSIMTSEKRLFKSVIILLEKSVNESIAYLLNNYLKYKKSILPHVLFQHMLAV